MQHWLSFSSHKKGFLGVVIVEASNKNEALTKAIQIAPDAAENACGIEGVLVDKDYEPKWLNRLITKPEIYDIGYSTKDKEYQ